MLKELENYGLARPRHFRTLSPWRFFRANALAVKVSAVKFLQNLLCARARLKKCSSNKRATIRIRIQSAVRATRRYSHFAVSRAASSERQFRIPVKPRARSLPNICLCRTYGPISCSPRVAGHGSFRVAALTHRGLSLNREHGRQFSED